MPETNKIGQTVLTPISQLPGVVIMPDAKTPINMGSGVVTSLISSGGMALIYEIWNSELEVKRAIKLLHPDHTRDSEDRFQTEIKISAKLHHPNIVEIYAVGKWNELPYIEMERIDGQTLETLIAEVGGLPVNVCTAIGIMIGRALNYAHNQDYQIYGKEYHGIIHRDLKPGNVMITNDGIVKLMDFGIAKPMDASTRTMEGVVMGTMQYLAPEQLDGKDIDARADIYSLGAVLYETFTGARAFPEQNLAKLVTDKLSNNYVPLEKYSRRIPTQLCNLVHKCLKYEKEKRVQNALEFLKILGNIHKSQNDKSPEQILQQYMKEIHHGKTMVSVNKKNVFFLRAKLPLIASLSIGATIVIAGMFANFHGTADKNSFKADTTKSVLPADSVKAAPLIILPNGNGKDTVNHDTASNIKIRDVFRPIHPAPALSKTASVSTNAKVKNKKQDLALEKTKSRKNREKTVALFQNQTSSNKTDSNKATAALPVVVQPQETVTPKMLIEKLKRTYKTSDLMLVFTKEVEIEHFQNALVVSDSLDKSDATTKKTIIYKLRVFNAVGDKISFSKLLFSNEIYDGEFYLEKALYFMDQRDFFKAADMLKKSGVTPCGFQNSRLFQQKLLYTKALCADAIYDSQASNENRKKALSAWVEIKLLFKSTPEHPYFKKADSEIRRINKT
jgi:serine/threonine protein kinase